MSCLARILFVLALFFTLFQNTLPALAQNVTVSAQVSPPPPDVLNEIISTTGNGPFAQGSEILYEIIYGQTTSSPQSITLQAQWSQGHFSGGVNSPSVEILEYVIGSASDAYNSAPPIIDLTNRTITWNIATIPANTTDQKVSFKLKTTSNYTGNARAQFTVTSQSTIVTTTVSDSITQSYQYNFDSEAYLKALTPPPTGTPTPTPTPPPNLSFEYIIIPEIRSDMAKVEIKTNIHTKATIRYGNSPNNLNSTLFSNSPRIYHFFTLDELKPDTEYYFQVEISDSYRSRASITSDIYTFKTAIISDAPQLNLDSITFTSSNLILFDGFTTDKDNLKNRIVTIPTNTPFEFKFSLAEGESVKSVLTTIREGNLSQSPVLGISLSPQTVPHANFAQIVEIEKGVYIGRLLSTSSPGLTDVIVRVSDFDGNVVEYKIGTIKTINPMRIVSERGGRGLENARVELYLYNPTQKIYQAISPEVIPIPNPSFSNSEGLVDIVLPHGKYRAEISLVRYEDKTVDFTIAPHDSTGYPTVELKASPFALFETIKYYFGILFDLGSFWNSITSVLSGSVRVYDLLNILALFLLIATSVLLLSQTIWNFYEHIFYPFFKRFRGRHSEFVQIIVSNITDHQKIRHAHVYLIDLQKDKIVARARTNIFGYATFHIAQPKKFRITALHKGYEAQQYYDFKNGEFTGTQTIWMKEYKSSHHPLGRRLKHMAAFLYEIILAALVMLEILFSRKYGITAMLPFYILLGITILFYIIHWIIGRKK